MEKNRRSFLKKTAIAGIGLGTYPFLLKAAKVASMGTPVADADAIGQKRLAIDRKALVTRHNIKGISKNLLLI